jgi:transcription elongation factor GreA
MKGIYLTKEGIDKLQLELKHLIDVDRKEIIKKIKETREFGDLSENAEYDEARNQQSMIEGRIEELEAILKNAKVLDEGKAHSSAKVVLGSRVNVMIESDTQEFTIVSSAEANPAAGLISDESPLGRALMGAKEGEVVTVEIPDGGSVEYKILSVK